MSETTDNAPDGMLAYHLAIENPYKSDPNWPLPSFDARDWARSFCEIAAKNGHHDIDEGWMISWFANALMRGYDENARRVGKLLGHVRNATDIQRSPGNWNCNHYMHGMANGLIFALHTMENGEGTPPYLDAPKKWLDDRPRIEGGPVSSVEEAP